MTTAAAPRRHASIARSLTAMNMLVSGAALTLASLGFAAYEVVTFRQTLVQNLSLQAQIIGANSVSSILFTDPKSAEATLAALRAAPRILAAEIRTPDNRMLAGYWRDDARPVMSVGDMRPEQLEVGQIDRAGITLARRIVFEGKPTGTVYIRSDLEELYARLSRYGVIVAGVLLASLATALVVSHASQRSITRPLSQLADVARRVSDERDYSMRAPPLQQDNEIAVLIEAFNEMLGQIQARDRSLQDARDQLEDRVERRTRELTEVNSELEAFSYSVSHDLRAPLRHVMGFATLLEAHAGPKLDERSRSHMGKIVGAASSMGRLIDDLLAFSRMGRTTLTKQRVVLGPLVGEVRAEVMRDAGDRKIDWEIGPLPEVGADPGLLHSVLFNLMSNAVKYTGTRSEARIEIGATSGPEVVVFVRDNGVGFDMQYADKLFGVFQRLHRADEFTGTGIGLANVRRIIQRHGGRTWAEARVDVGATFFFSLPNG